MSERCEETEWAVSGGDVIVYSGPLNLSGVLAALLSIGLPLGGGIAAGWSFGRSALYTALALVYLALVVGYLVSPQLARAFSTRPGFYLTLCGLVPLGLLLISNDPHVQPLAFTVPFVFAVLLLGPERAAAVGGLYLGLIVAGLWLSGTRAPAALLSPAATYGAIMLFMFAVVRIAIDQALARREAARLAAENARLAAENARSAKLEERNRIARELHDTIAQGLTALNMQLEAAQRAFERDPERARARLSRAHELARDALGDVRRSVWALAEQPLDGPALGAALADQARHFSERSGVAAAYRHQGLPLDLPGDRAAQVLRIVQEALQNVEKHAAAATVEIGSRHTPAGVEVWVRDDGRGFDPADPPVRANGAGFGLPSLHERARLAGGSLLVESAPGGGTRLAVHLPEGK